MGNCCPNCQKELIGENYFCPYCGKKLKELNNIIDNNDLIDNNKSEQIEEIKKYQNRKNMLLN